MASQSSSPSTYMSKSPQARGGGARTHEAFRWHRQLRRRGGGAGVNGRRGSGRLGAAAAGRWRAWSCRSRCPGRRPCRPNGRRTTPCSPRTCSRTRPSTCCRGPGRPSPPWTGGTPSAGGPSSRPAGPRGPAGGTFPGSRPSPGVLYRVWGAVGSGSRSDIARGGAVGTLRRRRRHLLARRGKEAKDVGRWVEGGLGRALIGSAPASTHARSFSRSAGSNRVDSACGSGG